MKEEEEEEEVVVVEEEGEENEVVVVEEEERDSDQGYTHLVTPPKDLSTMKADTLSFTSPLLGSFTGV